MRPRAKHEARAVPFRGESRRGITTKSSVQRERPIWEEGVSRHTNSADRKCEQWLSEGLPSSSNCSHQEPGAIISKNLRQGKTGLFQTITLNQCGRSDPHILLAGLWCHHHSTFFGRPEVWQNFLRASNLVQICESVLFFGQHNETPTPIHFPCDGELGNFS